MHQEIHQQVSRAYTEAVQKGGCCGQARTQKGTVVKYAGYEQDELSNLPADAVSNSFGCGNPLAFSQVLPGQTVVDLGAGAGIDILLAGQKVGPEGHVIGVDMTDAMLERAQKNITESGMRHVEVRKGLIEDLPIEDQSADWVISNCVINLSPQKKDVFEEMFRVLKPGGQVSVSDIMVEELPEELRQKKALYNSCVSGAISEAEYVSGMLSAGFQKVDVVERLVYDRSQLKAFIQSEEMPDSGKSMTAEELDLAVSSVAGKIWSAKIHATK